MSKGVSLYECSDRSPELSDTLKAVLVNIFETLVPFSELLSFEGTIGVTVDKKHSLLLHFSDAISKASIVGGVSSTDKDCRGIDSKTSTESSLYYRQVTDSSAEDYQRHSPLTTGTPHHGEKRFLSDAGFVPTCVSDYPHGSHKPESTERLCGSRKRGQRPKSLVERVAASLLHRTPSTSGHRQSSEIGMVSAQQDKVHADQLYVNIVPGADGSRAKTNVTGYPVICNDDDDDGQLSQPSPVSDEGENIHEKENSKTGRERTLLRQLLQNNCKARKNKRKSSDSDDYQPPYKISRVITSMLAGDPKTSGHSVTTAADHEGNVITRQSTLRSNATRKPSSAKKDSTVDSSVVDKRSSDSILCRLLTSSVNIYDTTEVEQLRRASTSGSDVASGQHFGKDVETDEVVLNIKVEKDAVETDPDPPVSHDRRRDSTMTDGANDVASVGSCSDLKLFRSVLEQWSNMIDGTSVVNSVQPIANDQPTRPLVNVKAERDDVTRDCRPDIVTIVSAARENSRSQQIKDDIQP